MNILNLVLFVYFDVPFKLLTSAILKPEASHPYLILVFSQKVLRSQTKIEWDLSLLLNRVQFMVRRNPRTSQSIETHIVCQEKEIFLSPYRQNNIKN